MYKRQDYDPTDRLGAMHRLQWAQAQREFITGLVYYDPSRPSLAEASRMVDAPLVSLGDERLRPGRDVLGELMNGLM